MHDRATTVNENVSQYLAEWQSRRDQTTFRFRPERRDGGRPPLEPTSAKSSETFTDKTRARASNVATVTFSLPLSTRPTYERSISASNAKRSWDRPLSTRSRLRFQPMVRRTSIIQQMHIGGLTIDGLTVPNYSS